MQRIQINTHHQLTFKPTTVKDFVYKEVPREWNENQKAALKQSSLFEEKKNFDVVRKLPYKFSYVFSDVNEKERTLMNEDWELGALYWNCLERHNGDEKAACEDVKRKYFDDFSKTVIKSITAILFLLLINYLGLLLYLPN